MDERIELALTMFFGLVFIGLGLVYAGDGALAPTIAHLAVGSIAVLLGVLRYDAARRDLGDGRMDQIRRKIRKIRFDEPSAGVELPTSREEWRRWSKPRRSWLINTVVFVAIGFLLAAIQAPTWSTITAFAIGFLSQAPILYYEWRAKRQQPEQDENHPT